MALLVEMAKSSSVESAKGVEVEPKFTCACSCSSTSIQPGKGDRKSMALAGVTYLTSPLVNRWEIALQRLTQNG